MDLFFTLLLYLAAAFFSTVAFSVLFSVPKRQYLFCGIVGTFGYAIYYLVNLKSEAVLATFFATVAVALVSRLLAVVRKCPVTVLMIPGIIPLAPGAGVYYTAYNLMRNDASAAAYANETLKIALAIVLGIIIVFALPIKHRAFMLRPRKAAKEP